ncbi:TIM barrel protein [Treponema sp. OttesenSCG-928-L16]|nr:TIM barrel protein [Treponema sp. OttesenSCG-928-L16]
MNISLPSWVIPGTYGENLIFLENKSAVSGVELLFYLYGRDVRDELERDSPVIEEYASRFTYTAHLPDKVTKEHEELVERLFPVVRHFIVHPMEGRDAEALARLIADWEETFSRDRENSLFLFENTKPGRLESQLELLPSDTGLCMDTGHLLLEGRDPEEFFRHYGPRIREIHLHAADTAAQDGRLADHRPLGKNEPWLVSLIPLLRDFTGIINIELFSWEEAAASIDILLNMTKGPLE